MSFRNGAADPGRRVALTLALTVALAVTLCAVAAGSAWRTAARHRLAAETAVRRQVALLAGGVANSAQVQAWFAIRTLLKESHSAALAGTLPPAAELTARAAREAIGPGLTTLEPIRYFTVHPATWQWQVSGAPLTGSARAGRQARLSAAPIGSDSTTIPAPNPAFGVASGSGRLAPRFRYLVVGGEVDSTVLVVAPLNARGLLHGFEVPLQLLRDRVFASVVGEHRLSGVTSDGHDESIAASVRFTTPDGAVLYSTSPPPEGPFLARAAMSGSLAATVELSLPPAAAGLLVEGGLPASPGAWILASFLLLTGLIVGTGLVAWRALELGRLRSEFASSMTHELRTPLTQIQLFAETLLLERARSPESRRGAVEAIVRETRRLVAMLENVLAVSRVGRPSERLLFRPEDIDRLVEEVMAGFGPLLKQRGITPLVLTGEAGMAAVDAEAVRRILINLVDNAIRHAPGGKAITVTATIRGPALVLTVEDEGPGLAEAEVSRLWQPFERGGSTGGSGLGLAVVRRLVDLHGGAVRVERGQAGGARFLVTLPLPDQGSGAAA
jgi:signal transduction histidine kinase